MASSVKRRREEGPDLQADAAAPGHIASRRRRKRLQIDDPRRPTLGQIVDWAAFAAVAAGLVLAVFYLAFA